MLLITAITLTFVAIFLDQALRRHRLPNHDFLVSLEIADPAIYDATGRRLLIPTLIAWLGMMIAWFTFLLR
jgi:hypothetical protein